MGGPGSGRKKGTVKRAASAVGRAANAGTKVAKGIYKGVKHVGIGAAKVAGKAASAYGRGVKHVGIGAAKTAGKVYKTGRKIVRGVHKTVDAISHAGNIAAKLATRFKRKTQGY